MPLKGRSFGQERPPLTDLLKNILLRYPDGGQILKELIQNADDAGANEVKFLFDATSYGTASLVSPELALFQGPALYCYNNAEFTDDDWEGLQRLMRSNKQNNPLKVGRFGIGFNSVYHITDLPSIVSGNTVAFLDPHEKYFVRSEPGRAFSTEDSLLLQNFDQFEPFHQMFDCNLSQGNHYNGTFFRFPLRTQPSQLSSKIYTKKMVQALFESFRNEASAILLFLKNVDSVSLYERQERGEIFHLYTAKVSEKSKTEVRKKRKELIQDITVEWNFAVRTTFYRLEIERECPGKPTEKSEWFLANQVGTTDKKIVALAGNLKLLPWISIAFPVDANNNMSSLGRIFCFLPLPPDCRTGLPVQMNGYFGLTDNRRALKWPGPDCQNDETAQWNQLLLEKVGSQVYANLIVNLTRENSVNLSSETLAQLVYTAIPVYSNVRDEWRCILQQFFRTVLTKAIFFTTAKGNSRWVTLGEAIIDRLDESKGVGKEIKKVVLHTLLSAGQPIVSLPVHVMQVIDQYHQMSGWTTLQKVTPVLLCNVLRSNFDFHKLEMPFQERLFVLEYALQNVPGNISNLYNVPLLPLENRQFIKFSHPSVEKIFIPSMKHSADLLPNMKNRLLYRTLPPQLQQKLNELGSSKATQLHHPTENDMKQLLWQNLPKDWSCSYLTQLETVTWNPGLNGHPSLAWLELVWKWINENYPWNLAEFEGMPLIPVAPSSMARLRQNSSVIVAEHPMCNETLSDLLRDFLIKSGCVVVKKLHSFVKHDKLFNYVAPPNPSGILRILSVARERVVQQLTLASNKVKNELCSILSRLEGINLFEKSFIRTLPIFEALDGSHFVSCQTERGEPRLVAPRNLLLPSEFRIIDRTNILSSSKDENYRLLRKLDRTIESTASLIRSHLENFLNSGIGNVEKDKLVLWILEKIDVLNQEMPAFVGFIRELACVPTASGQRIAPNKLFDHSDELLIRLLEDNNMAFPTSKFSEPIRRRKNELYVRHKENLTAQDVLVIVSQTPELSLDRGMALVELMNQRPQLLRKYTEDRRLLSSYLREFPWLPRVQKRPANYPDFIPWYDGMVLCKPSNMQPDYQALLVGATVPLFENRLMSQKVQDLLGMSRTIDLLKDVIEQLHLAVALWTNQTTATKRILAKFEEMVKCIYMHLQQASKDDVKQLLQSKGLTQWVWHGSGFTSPEKIALDSHFPSSIKLHPYLFCLPKELFKVKEFLLSHGMKPQFTVDDLLDMLWNIKVKHDEKTQELEEVTQDLDQCRAVLEWIVRRGGELTEERRSKLLIPVQSKPDKLQLEPCKKCTFCDREFLRQGISEHGISIKSYLIHKAIPDDLAGRLRVPRLSSCLAGAKAVGINFKEAGQYEPITTRLRNILQQYKEGVTIFKEIIQNADDAGASKVCFVVDWRENSQEKLLTEELAKCQGPALWAYNDAIFSEEDFQNINKLAGETKKEDLNKVGRFGLGFNSVYHLTDVPSFVSGEHIVVFDPNMNHISKVIDGKMRSGGFMLSLAENKQVLSAFPDQFSPYHQLFGCDMTGTGKFHFEGTLFRLPFRTSTEAQESEISKEPYTRENVNNLVKSLTESAATLLLFTQNVKEVQVFEIQKNSTPKKSLKRSIISITKSLEKIVHTNDADRHGEGTILQNSSTWLLNNRNSSMVDMSGPRRTELLRINVSTAKSHLNEVASPVRAKETWLVNSCAGERSSLQVAQSDDGIKNAVVPVTGIAAKMTHSNGNDTKIFPVTGEVFCFMPLSIESGFPVHVNGSFSVYSNRRRLWEEGIGEHKTLKPFEAKWNEALMQDSLVQAYLQLLEMLTSYNGKQYEFHTLWPNPTKVNYPKAWKPFLHSFFSKIIDEEWPLFYSNGNWLKIQDCLILDPKLNKVADCVTIMILLGEHVLSLPQEFMEAFKSSGKETFIKNHMLTEDRFLREFFFPRITQIPNQLRNSVLVYIVDRRLSKHRNYDDLLQTYPCFSCSKDGTLLRKPNELVHPKGKAACLFSEEEKRFPSDDRVLEKERAMMLEELGMAIDFLPWWALCERAEWICKHCDVKRAELLIEYMNQMALEYKITDEETETLRATQFLPILSKPKDFPFSWKSDECSTRKLAAADHLYTERHKYLVGSFQLILDESSNKSSVPNQSLKKILGLFSKQPELSNVIAQLDLIIQLSPELPREKKEQACSTIYDFFQKVVTTEKFKSEQSFLHEQLECRPWMLIKNEMVNSKLVARNWNKEDASPYLYSLPYEYSRKFNGLTRWFGVKDNFLLTDFVKAISNLRDDIGCKELAENNIRTLIVLLEEILRLNDGELPIALPLVSVDCRLYDANELAINDTPWLETDGTNKLVHEKIPPILAYKCGAKELRNADLTRCSEPIGQPFGQHEKLTDRLKNILSAYPADEGILKELLQNADDAKANEIHFVFDPRTHGDKHVFSSKWKDLQGPAICVYNDKPFSKEDIEGIQKLGIGSKVDDPLKTGQYGIGFNAVYHLTDCPYFISNDEVICVSDPHTAYAPGASGRNPGRLFSQLNQKFRRNYQDFLSGFLGDLFDLKGGTMFRLPLRGNGKLQSKISKLQWDEKKVKELFTLFRQSAKNMLLFLNNVTKISVSEIKNGKLETYSVMCEVSDKGKRAEFFEKIKAYSKVPTQQVPRHEIHYVMKMSDTNNVKKDWLVTQSLGYTNHENISEIPNGSKMGLLPRAGIATLLAPCQPPFRHSVFCILPLPVSTKLPAHINGHFALDSARRNVWNDPKSSDDRVVWNKFIKRQVVAPAYASALLYAREHILDYRSGSDTFGTFSSKRKAEDGLKWYHQLFPCINELDAAWKPVGEALYQNFLPALPVLPVAMPVPKWKKHLTESLVSSSSVKAEPDHTRVKVTWCKVHDAYFCTSGMSSLLKKTLLEIGFRLLSHTPSAVYESFKAVKHYQDVSPEQVRKFLHNHSEMKDSLPKEVKDSVLQKSNNVSELTKYCAEAEDFLGDLEGLPLLLTQDGILRCFCRDFIVFCSSFNELLPSRPELFLHDSLRRHYVSGLEKCSNVIQEFLIPDLAKFQGILFPSTWINATSHQPWDRSEEDDALPSKAWLKLLWEFIDYVSKNSEKKDDILREIVGWHIIPTTQNCLVPVSMGKTVLNVSTYLNSDSAQDKNIRALLVKLGCPQLNHKILTSSSSRYSSSTGATAVRKHYLAMVQSTEDVLGLLHQTLNGDISEVTVLTNHEIERLLMFLQIDHSTLRSSFLRDLPFYQTISGNYTRLSNHDTVYEIPASVPEDDLQVLATVTNCIFLRQAPKLADLYKYIGVKPASSVKFYIRIILKFFTHLTPKGRENHLKFVRDHLLNYYCDNYEVLLNVMKQLPFIPDQSGVLCPAKEFYDPDNKVFQEFVSVTKFPPKPYDSSEWKEFLQKVGLQHTVTEDHFIQYAKQLEKEAHHLSHPDEAKKILQKSDILVSHLIGNKSLYIKSFVSQISKIRFVPAAKIKKLYLGIHPSHTKSILTCFNGSVHEKHAALVWSSASLIAASAFPHRKDNLAKMLGVHNSPPHEHVISHARNISARFSANKKEVPSSIQPALSAVMTLIYNYFYESCNIEYGPPHENCSSNCKLTMEALHNVPVILIDRHTFVLGSQLAFTGVWDKINPYMFKIPRAFQRYEHFFKCLGAQESPTPLQYSSVLETIKRSCKDNPMHPGEIIAAVSSTKCLFITLSDGAKSPQDESDTVQSLEKVRTLYLPTEDDHLMPSCEVFVNDTMEKKERLKDYWKELLIDLTMKDQEPPAKLVELLPSHLKVNKLSSKLEEQLSPNCIDKMCILDQNSTASRCEFIKQYRRIICSREFSEALIRLYKFQEDKVKISEQVENDLRSLEKGVKISCMQTIKVQLVTKATMQPIPDSVSEVSTFCQKSPDGFSILIKHGGEGNPGILHARLSSFISRITGQHIGEAKWHYLMMIYGVQEPGEISKTLDEARVPESIGSRSGEPNPGDEIPEHLHDLLKNDVDYYLREGEWVGYEVREENEENEAVYVYAKIIKQTYQGDGTFAFNSKYLIDVGKEEPVEVSRLKLYKFDRGEKTADGATSSRDEKMDLVPYEGDETDKPKANARPREPVTLEDAKREVAEALKEIWQLPELERSSAIKRLIRRWHPDKNKHRESFATEVTKFLLNEVERLKRGGVPGYHPTSDNSNQSPRRPSRPTWDGPDFTDFFNRYQGRARQRQRHRERQYTDNEDEPANRKEAERWMRQAEDDLDATSCLFESAHYSLSCFHCQQAVEKALKALMFAKGRLKKSDLDAHDVMALAYRASGLDPRLRTIPEMVARIQGYYINTRYPQYRRGFSQSSIPAEMFTQDDANDAISKTNEIFLILRQVLN